MNWSEARVLKYTQILNAIKDKNVELRHDVDVSLQSAFNMAKVEKMNDVKSIYYIRFDSDCYNPLSFANSKIINYLASNHEIGCHVDVTEINNENELVRYLDTYNKILPFKKFTFHINTEKTKLFGHLKKYDNKSILINDYISDSKNNFTNTDFQQVCDLDNFTLLIHPEWWDNKEFTFRGGNGRKKLLQCLRLEEMCDKIEKEILG